MEQGSYSPTWLQDPETPFLDSPEQYAAKVGALCGDPRVTKEEETILINSKEAKVDANNDRVISIARRIKTLDSEAAQSQAGVGPPSSAWGTEVNDRASAATARHSTPASPPTSTTSWSIGTITSPGISRRSSSVSGQRHWNAFKDHTVSSAASSGSQGGGSPTSRILSRRHTTHSIAE